MTLETERQLLDAVCSGDRRAMRRLYDRYAGYAMGTALRFIVEEDDVRDVVQDSFVKVFTTIGHFDFRGEGSLKAWINRIVTNQSIDFLKSRQRITFVSDVPDDTADEAPEVELVPSEVLTRLIAKLPTGYRLVLNLVLIDGLDYEEISSITGEREGTIRTQYSRARKMLASKLTEIK